MIHAYDETYLVHSSRVLGWMLDSAVNLFGMKAEAFWRIFISTGYAERFGKGESRLLAGMTQEALSAASGVPLRMIQHYEQRSKNLAKAAFDTVFRLAQALHVPPQGIVEP